MALIPFKEELKDDLTKQYAPEGDRVEKLAY